MGPGEKIPVVAIHGALRSPVGMLPTCAYLRQYGLDARPFGYWTRRHSLARHVSRLSDWLEAWLRPQCCGGSVPTLGFITHSMGALIVRAYLSSARGRALSQNQRFVMLAPPNQGSALAEHMEASGLSRLAYRTLYGRAASELLPSRVRSLGQPPESCSTLVLVGGRGDNRGYNPRLPGDDDGVVTTAESKLDGIPLEFVGGVHALIQWRRSALRRAAEFLRQT